MATHGARRLTAMADNVAGVVGIELLAAVQGLEFHRPLKTSKALENVVRLVRDLVPNYDRDRFFARDIGLARALVTSGVLRAWLGDAALGS